MNIKIAALFFLVITILGLLPRGNYLSPFSTSEDNVIKISYNECGCECPDADILEGQVIVPEAILKIKPDINLTMVNFTQQQIKDLEGINSDIIMKGSVTGYKEINCDVSGCLSVPEFEVSEWKMANYLSAVLTYDLYFIWFYLLLFMKSFVLLLLMLFKKLIVMLK